MANKTLRDKSMVIQTGNPADPIDEEVFDYNDVKESIKVLRQKLYLVNTVDDDFIENMNKRLDKKLKEVFGDELVANKEPNAESKNLKGGCENEI